MNQIDTLWMIISTLLVFGMIFGLALIGAGAVRSKNSLSFIMQTISPIGLVLFVWIAIGYTIVFGKNGNLIAGGLNYLFLSGVGLGIEADVAETIPHIVFFIFQSMFALIACLIIIGSVAERVSFKFFLIFSPLWILAVYSPVAHWVWGHEGWIKQLGAIDFAGGLVVHITSGFSALILTNRIGRRKDYFGLIKKFNAPTILTGLILVWLGWLGFNGGSALAMNNYTVMAIINTLIASIFSMTCWLIIDLFHTPHKTFLTELCLGVISGLVAITPSAGYLTPFQAIITGFSAGLIGNYSVRFMHKMFKQDDTLDVFSTHGVCGFLGAFLTGIFIHYRPGVLFANMVGSTVVAFYSMLMTFILMKLISKFIPLRISETAESEGLDLLEHGEQAINI